MNKQCVFLAVFALIASASSCTNPEITTKSFTTQDATIVTHIAYISEFTVKCESDKLSGLYAEVEPGNVIPAGLVGPDTYQVSWTEELKTAKSGSRNVKVYNDEGYNTLKRQSRGSEEQVEVKPVFTLTVNHTGAYGGPWVKSEFVAAVSFLLVAYFALSTRAKIVA